MHTTTTPQGRIPGTQQAPTIGRVVHVKYLRTAGDAHSMDTLPGYVIRAFPTDYGHPLVTVAVFSDRHEHGPGPHVLASVPLFDPLNPERLSPTGEYQPPVVPDGLPIPVEGPFTGTAVWCEWMPYQKQKDDDAKAAGGYTAPPR